MILGLIYAVGELVDTREGMSCYKLEHRDTSPSPKS